jgi:AraC-like DNA-binding protein
VVCDISPVSPEFQVLAPLLKGAQVRELNASVLASLADEFVEARRGKLDAASVRNLLHRMIFSLTGRQPQPPKLNPHVVRVLQLIQEYPLDAANPTWLAEQVNLSPSWLRSLFRKEIGSSLSQYLRWSAIWKAVWLWSPGEPWAEYASAAGFHDFSHFNRAFNATFGVNPSTLSNPDQSLLIRCEWD